MEQMRRTAAEVLGVIDAALSTLDHSDRLLFSAPERVALMNFARKVQERVTSLTCVLTDEASLAALSATGTPLTSLIGLSEGRDSSDAAREVFQARDLNKNSSIRDAALNGEVSPRHAAAIAKGLDTLPTGLTGGQVAAAEQAFIRRALKNTPKQLTELAAEVLAEVAPELAPAVGDDDAVLEAQRRRARTKRHLKWGDDGDGSMWFKGSLPHLEAAPLLAVVQAYAESDRREERDRLNSTRATKPRPQFVREQVVDDNHRTPDQRRADALTQLISEHREAPRSLGDRPRIVVTIREQDLRDKAEKAGVLPSGAKITAGDLRRLVCDADLMPVVLGGHSEILDVGRTQRLATPAIRKALTLRDGGCIFPGCNAPDTRCEAHHLKPWWDGGETALTNLVLLCGFHHKLVEPDRYRRPGDRWVIHIDHDTGQPIITAPGRTEAFREMGGSAGAQPKDPQPAQSSPGPAPPVSRPLFPDPHEPPTLDVEDGRFEAQGHRMTVSAVRDKVEA